MEAYLVQISSGSMLSFFTRYFIFVIFVLMLRSLNKYKPVMGVIYNGSPITDKIKVFKLITSGKKIEIMSWNGGDVLFYFNPETNDVVYANDITYTYMVDGKSSTALELIKEARSKGFIGNDTRRAAQHLTAKGFNVKNNPNPTAKFKGLRSH